MKTANEILEHYFSPKFTDNYTRNLRILNASRFKVTTLNPLSLEEWATLENDCRQFKRDRRNKIIENIDFLIRLREIDEELHNQKQKPQ